MKGDLPYLTNRYRIAISSFNAILRGNSLMEEKKNQIWAFAITGVLILISMIYYQVNPYYIYVVVYIWFGFAYGMMLQYGRFCFASASRDLFAAGSANGRRYPVALVFFSLIQATLASTDMSTFPSRAIRHTYLDRRPDLRRGHGALRGLRIRLFV